MHRKYIFHLLSIFLLCSTVVFSQTGTIRGFVYEKETGEPVIFTNVYLQGTTYGVATDVNGYYNINKIKPGKYTLIVSYIGYDTLKTSVNIEANRIISQNLFIKESSIKLKEFVVSAERQEMRTQVRTSIVKITPKNLEKIPTIGSEPDLAQYLQVVPGVVFTGDQGGQLYIRGGSPIQNKVLLDGLVVYNPFHSIGLFSVFDSDIIRNADIYTGGFNAKYGGRISSVMDITTRDGNRKRFSGKISTSTFGSKLLLEGPLKKLQDEEAYTISYILSAKSSYLEQSSEIFYNYIDTAGLPFNFTDVYGKVSVNGVSGTKINIFGFNFKDKVSYKALSDLNWNSAGIGGNAILVPLGSDVLVKANVAYSNYDITLSQLDDKPRYSSIEGYNVGLDFLYFIGGNELSYGIESLGFKTDYQYYNSVGRKLEQKENTTEFGVYAKYKQTLGNLLIEPSFRFHYYASLSNGSAEPRLGLKYNVNDVFRIKFAGGYYSQNLIATNSDRDVVNLFYGFLSGTRNLQDYLPSGEEVTSYIQKSRHAILGFEWDLTERINLNVEGYLKDNNQLISINRNKIYDDTGENSDKDDYYKKDMIVESGQAYGVDFLIKYDYNNLYIWTVYSLGYINRDDGVIVYSPHYERRHNVNFLASYRFGKNKRYEISMRWNYGSGFPFTQTGGMYEALPFDNGLDTDFLSMNGDLGIIYGELNEGQLSDYHRLDVNAKYTLKTGKYSELQLTAGITNLYDRQNVFYFDRVSFSRVNQLPFMPSIGASYTF